MNILYLFGGEKAQGAEIVIERLLNEMAETDRVHLLLSPGTFAQQLQNAHKPYRVATLSSLRKLNRSLTSKLVYLATALKNYLWVPVRVNHYIRRNDIQVIHANTLVPASYLTLLVLYSRLFRPRLKWIWSDHDMRYFSGFEKKLANLCVRLYDRTLVVSYAVKAKYQNTASKAKVEVLYNGLDLQVFRPDSSERGDFRKTLGIPAQAVVIGIAGVIHPDKGQLALIQAVKPLLNHYPPCYLLLAGDFAGQSPEYTALIKAELRNADHIRHIGYVSPVTNFYNGCDIIVNNSNRYRSESLGTSIYEAMACEKIVLAAATGGTPEIIVPGESGYLFPADDAAALQHLLRTVVQTLPGLQAIRKAARNRVAERFQLRTMLTRYRQLLNEI